MVSLLIYKCAVRKDSGGAGGAIGLFSTHPFCCAPIAPLHMFLEIIHNLLSAFENSWERHW